MVRDGVGAILLPPVTLAGVSAVIGNERPGAVLALTAAAESPNRLAPLRMRTDSVIRDAALKGGVTAAEVDGSGLPTPAWIHNDIRVYACVLEPGQSVAHGVAAGREAYVHVIQDVKSFDSEHNLTALRVNGQRLGGGDGAFLKAAKAQADSAFGLTLEGAGQKGAKVEFLLFDVKKDA